MGWDMGIEHLAGGTIPWDPVGHGMGRDMGIEHLAGGTIPWDPVGILWDMGWDGTWGLST